MNTDKRVKVEEEEAARKRTAEDDSDEAKTATFLRKLEYKERKQMKRDDDQRAKFADDFGEMAPTSRRIRRCEKRVDGFVVDEEVMEVEVGDDVEDGWTEDDELDPGRRVRGSD